MYHVFGTGLTAILLYLISYLFSRTGLYSPFVHKKLWNSLLAITFLVTAIAGLFMALQINYKWDIPVIKSVVKWHVRFGIGMAFTGIFHFLWHLSYFRKIFNRQDNSPDMETSPKLSSTDITSNLFIIGFVSSSIQLLLIREIMNISGGYELITGVFLGSWLIASAIGSSLAGRSQLSDIKKINLIFSLSPIISLILLLFLSRLFLNTGETPSLLVSIIYTFLVLIPFCLVSGFTFVKLMYIARSGNNFMPGKSFAIDTIGGIVAGILISLLTSGIMNTYQLLLLIILTSIAYVLLTFYISNLKTKTLAKFCIIALATTIIVFNPDIFFRHLLLPGITITTSKDTPYGNITKGNYQGEQSIYYNQRLLAYNDDAVEREEDIHYAMLQSESPEKVILVSGFLNSLLQEIHKYPVKKLIYIERDPALTESQMSTKDIFKGELVIENKDAFRYIKRFDEPADVVILLIPPPSTLLLNRYYTTEFFTDVKKCLNKDGVFMCSPGPGETYFNKESLNLYSSIYNSMAGVFKNVEPIVGNKLYLLASDKELSVSFCKLAKQKNINNIYVNPDYLDDEIITNKSEEVKSLFDKGIKQNRSSFPVANFFFQSYNFSKNRDEKTFSIVLMILIFAVPVLTIKRKNLPMYFSAAGLAGFEIIALVTLQLTVGNMYQLTGLIIAGLMTGLAIGSAANIRILRLVSFRIKGILLLVFYTVIGLIYNNILELKGEFLSIFLIILSSLLPAILTGHLFNELTRKNDELSLTSKIYSADLTGSAFGFIFIAGFAIPAFGIKVSLFLLSSLIFVGLVFGTNKMTN